MDTALGLNALPRGVRTFEIQMIFQDEYIDDSECGNIHVFNELITIHPEECFDLPFYGLHQLRLSNSVSTYIDDSEVGSVTFKSVINQGQYEEDSEYGLVKSTQIICQRVYEDDSECGNIHVFNEFVSITQNDYTEDSEYGNNRVSNEYIIVKQPEYTEDSEYGNNSVFNYIGIKISEYYEDTMYGNHRFSQEYCYQKRSLSNTISRVASIVNRVATRHNQGKIGLKCDIYYPVDGSYDINSREGSIYNRDGHQYRYKRTPDVLCEVIAFENMMDLHRLASLTNFDTIDFESPKKAYTLSTKILENSILDINYQEQPLRFFVFKVYALRSPYKIHGDGTLILELLPHI